MPPPQQNTVIGRVLGFTLAEVLVTLGIIGIISALTLPTLVKNHQKKVYVAQLQKVYTELEQAITNKINDQNAINVQEAGIVSGKESEFLNSYFKIAKDCGTDSTPCFANEYKEINGSISEITKSGHRESLNATGSAHVTLADGTAIGLKIESNLEVNYAIFFVDTNGTKGPNTRCRDFFQFAISRNNSSGIIGDSCVNYLIQNGWQMDETYDSKYNDVGMDFYFT